MEHTSHEHQKPKSDSLIYLENKDNISNKSNVNSNIMQYIHDKSINLEDKDVKSKSNVNSNTSQSDKLISMKDKDISSNKSKSVKSNISQPVTEVSANANSTKSENANQSVKIGTKEEISVKKNMSLRFSHATVIDSNVQTTSDKANSSHQAEKFITTSSCRTDRTAEVHSEPNPEDIEESGYPLINKSVPSSVNVNPNLITVTFLLDELSFTSAFKITSTVGEIKEILKITLELDEDFNVFYDDHEIEDYQSLNKLPDCQPYGKITLKINPEKWKVNTLMKEKVLRNIPTVDVITTNLGEEFNYKAIVVEIINEGCQKEWVGGYRNKLTGVEFHNAYSQTKKFKKVFETDPKSGEKIPLYFHRDTQTPFKLKEKIINTVNDKATQMWRTDLHIPLKNDKIITARPRTIFFYDKEKIRCAITIQRAVRKWIRRKKLYELIDYQIKMWEEFRKEQQEIYLRQMTKEREMVTSSAFPSKRDDFYLLYLKVEEWWQREWKNNCETKSYAAKKAASCLLVDKEVKLLEAIEKHRILGKREALQKLEMRFLDRTSRPEVFRNSKGHFISIDSMETQKAKGFKEIYSALSDKNVQPKDRIELLINVKRLFELNYMSYEYANDLVSLLNNEIELLSIGIKLKDLKGLHKRIEQLFLDFLHQDEFNPAAAKYKKPNIPKTMHIQFMCRSCYKLLPASKYPVHVRMRSYTTCKSCTWLNNIAHKRVDMSPYLKLLKRVHNSEMEKCCHSAICFILQPIGMGYLTNIIWHGRSAISECSDLSKLQHVRWLPDIEWAPWNTILLTDQEAKLHESVPNVLEFYDEEFIKMVRGRHILARTQFIPLLIMDHSICSSGQWSSITDSGPFLHPSHAERMAVDLDYDIF